MAKNGDDQRLLKLTAENEPSLEQGFKYEFEFDTTKLDNSDVVQDIQVKNATMSGKEIGFSINSDIAAKLLKTVDGVVVLDTREKEDFDKGHIEGAINLPSESIKKLSEKDVDVKGLGLSSIVKDSVVLIFGDSNSNKSLAKGIYNVLGGNVLLDAGQPDSLLTVE